MIRKYLLAAATFVTIAGILTSFLILYPKRYDDYMKIEDISGDQSVLNNVTIKGTLSDCIQRTDFVFQNNKFTKTYNSVNDDSIDMYSYNKECPPNLPNLHVTKSFVIPDDADKRVTTRTDENGIKITETVANKAVMTLGTYDYELIETNVIIPASDYSIQQSYQENGNGTAQSSSGTGKDDGIDPHDLIPVETVGDKNFLYTTTGEDCTGFGGVYEIKIVNKHWTVTQENLAPLDLKDGKVQIVGMKASKDWFVYITAQNERVVLKPFNRITNLFTDDIDITQLPTRAKANILYNGNVNHSVVKIAHVFYNATIQDTEIFNIEIVDRDSDSLPKSSFYVVNMNESKTKLSYQEKTSFFNSQHGQYTTSRYSPETVMKYVNGRLYVLRKYLQLRYPLPNDNNSFPESCLHISVFKDDRSVYEGEIDSAAKDDYTYQGSPMYQAYGETYMRGFYYLEIE